MRALRLTRLATLAALGCLAAARLRTPEVEALWWLYTHTGGEFWNNNEGWDPSSDPCRAHAAPYRVFDVRPEPYEAEAVNATPWWGVGCFAPCDDYLDGLNCRAGRATALSLRNNGLAGDLSGWSAVAELRNLTVLDLSLNALRGTVPTELGEINNLERLKLDSNLLTGTIPPELGLVNSRGVYQLRELTLDNTALSGTLPTVLGAKASSSTSTSRRTGWAARCLRSSASWQRCRRSTCTPTRCRARCPPSSAPGSRRCSTCSSTRTRCRARCRRRGSPALADTTPPTRGDFGRRLWRVVYGSRGSHFGFLIMRSSGDRVSRIVGTGLPRLFLIACRTLFRVCLQPALSQLLSR